MQKKRLPLVCPSSMIDRPDAKVLGVIKDDGRVEYLAEPRPVTPEFVAIASQGRDPHLRFRFTSTCGQSGCKSWSGGRCSIADLEVDNVPPVTNALPACPIRATCRWFEQRGAAACGVCPQVIHGIFNAED